MQAMRDKGEVHHLAEEISMNDLFNNWCLIPVAFLGGIVGGILGMIVQRWWDN